MDSKQLEKNEEEFQYSELSLNRAGHSRFPDTQPKHAFTCRTFAVKGTPGVAYFATLGVPTAGLFLDWEWFEIFFGTKAVLELIFVGAESKVLVLAAMGDKPNKCRLAHIISTQLSMHLKGLIIHFKPDL
jgi:hypothetical protein